MKYVDESAQLWPEQLAGLPCARRCGFTLGDHGWRGGQLVCPRWTRRLARRLGDALARLSRVVGQ